MLPLTFQYNTWHDPPRYQQSLVVTQILDRMVKALGFIPSSLDAESDLRVFTNEAVIPICDEDIEPALFFPHRVYASRVWVRDLYQRFMAWCNQVGWLVTPTVPPNDIPESVAPVAAVAEAVVDEPAALAAPTPEPTTTKSEKKDGRQRERAVAAT